MPKVLLIEDGMDTRQIYRLLLQQQGWTVVESASAAEGLAELGRHRPDAVILDVNLPDALGLDVIPKIREIHDVPIVMVSGEEWAEPKAIELGVSQFILKPFDPFDELVPAVRKALGA